MYERMSILSTFFTGYKSCAELLEAGFKETGYYEIDPDGTEKGVEGFLVFCDMCTTTVVTEEPGVFY